MVEIEIVPNMREKLTSATVTRGMRIGGSVPCLRPDEFRSLNCEL